MFVKSDISAADGIASTWYNFSIPDGSRGCVLIPNFVFDIPTPEELYVQAARQRARQDHIDATKDPLVDFPH